MQIIPDLTVRSVGMEADDDWLFKSSLLVTMTNLVKVCNAIRSWVKNTSNCYIPRQSV